LKIKKTEEFLSITSNVHCLQCWNIEKPPVNQQNE
jgi:hypothetical protein